MILLLAWMAVIFLRSAKPADESTMESNFVGGIIGRIFVPDFEERSQEEQQAFIDSIEHVVRKTAHAAEYALLGLLAAGMFYEKGDRREWIHAFALCLAWAASDELHQLFVPGRSGMVTDVVIDGAGSLAGIALTWIIFRCIRGRDGCETDRKARL